VSGCFGASKEDKYFERRLDEYLDSRRDRGCVCDEGGDEN